MNITGNILVLTQWSFKDALIQTYTLPYVHIIRDIVSPHQKILVVTAEQERMALTEEEVADVNRSWAGRNMQLLAMPYRKFGIKKLIAAIGHLVTLYRVIKRENIRIIHAFCTPAGSIAYMLSKLTGARLILDSFEPHAESMTENGTWKKTGPAFRLLFKLEKLQARKADAVIGTTAGMKQYAKEKYGVNIENYFTKPACVDFNTFYVRKKDAELVKELGLENKIVCVYAGKFGGIYLKEEVFDFIKACWLYWNETFCFLALTDLTDAELAKEMIRTELPADRVIKKFVSHQEIPRYLSLGDFAINPVKPVPTKRFCTSIKDGEYWAMGLPVVIPPGISDDSDIIEENNIGVVADISRRENHLKAVQKINELLQCQEKEILQRKIYAVANQYRSFDIARKIYFEIYGKH